MVTEAGRNNIIALAYIGGFAIVILTFFFNYVQQADKATQNAVYLVKLGVNNVTNSQAVQTDAIGNLTDAVNTLVVLTIQDQNNTKANLGQFFGENRNQTSEIVTAIHEMQNNFSKVWMDQQNLTKYIQNLNEQRIELMNETATKLDQLLNSPQTLFEQYLEQKLNQTNNNITTTTTAASNQTL